MITQQEPQLGISVTGGNNTEVRVADSGTLHITEVRCVRSALVVATLLSSRCGLKVTHIDGLATFWFKCSYRKYNSFALDKFEV